MCIRDRRHPQQQAPIRPETNVHRQSSDSIHTIFMVPVIARQRRGDGLEPCAGVGVVVAAPGQNPTRQSHFLPGGVTSDPNTTRPWMTTAGPSSAHFEQAS
eukprot:880584-Rhodomonas_salina.1